VYAYYYDQPDPKGRITIVEVGVVVSLRNEPDSLVFRINYGIDVQLICVRQSNDYIGNIEYPMGLNLHMSLHPRKGTKMIAFDSRFHGAVGVVSSRYKNRKRYLMTSKSFPVTERKISNSHMKAIVELYMPTISEMHGVYIVFLSTIMEQKGLMGYCSRGSRRHTRSFDSIRFHGKMCGGSFAKQAGGYAA
jgi:hypothetical protein